MLSPAEFALLERKPLIINTARGGLVDQAALTAVSRSGKIAGVECDTISAEFMSLPNFILTPHVAWT